MKSFCLITSQVQFKHLISLDVEHRLEFGISDIIDGSVQLQFIRRVLCEHCQKQNGCQTIRHEKNPCFVFVSCPCTQTRTRTRKTRNFRVQTRNTNTKNTKFSCLDTKIFRVQKLNFRVSTRKLKIKHD